MQIIKAGSGDLKTIRHIATTAWGNTYKEILSPAQSGYMLNMMYSDESLLAQIKNGHQFILISTDLISDYVGFVSFEFDYQGSNKTKIHKLYVLPDYQGTGLGRLLIEHVLSVSVHCGNTSLSLNMNRYNQSFGFYQRLGFFITGEEDIDIGNGYLMEDYILEKEIKR